MDSAPMSKNSRPEVAVSAWKVPVVLALTLLSLIASSCGAVRTNQFKQFSQAGVSYSTAVIGLLDASGSTAIDTDSMELVKDRQPLTTELRSTAILRHNEELRKRLVILGEMKRHARLLSSYCISSASSGMPQERQSPQIPANRGNK